MTTVLLATDGSEYARQAAAYAVDLAAAQDATLHVIGVIDDRRLGTPALSSAELAKIYAEDDAATTVVEVRELAAEHSVPVEGETRHGVPHETIVEYADEIGAAAIVIGEHGDHDAHFSGVGRRVSELAECDVIVAGRELPAAA